MPWKPLPANVPLDNEAAPAPTSGNFAPLPADARLDEQSPAQADALPGFSDEQKQQILAYIPQAKDAADLERYSSELTQGRSKIGNAQAVLDAFAKGHREFGWTPPTAAKDPIQVNEQSTRDKIGEALLGALDEHFPGVGTFLRANRDSGKAFTEHAANALAFDYGPEVGGLIDTIIHPGSSLDNNVAHERAILEGDSQGHEGAALAGELGGTAIQALLGNAAGLSNLGRGARAAVTTGEGALYGSGAAGPDQRALGAVTGAALGAGTEAVAAGLAARSAAKAAAKTANSEFANAADRQGISYMAADLPKATKSKFATALSSITLGAIPLADQGAKNVASGASAVERAAANIGSVADKTGAGQAAQRGARQFMDASSKTLDDLESKIPIAPDAPAVVSATRAALGNLLQSFKSNPKLAAAFKDPRIASFMDALTPQTAKESTGVLDAAGNPITRDVTHGGGLSWNDLREFRTRVGQIIGQPGLASDGAQIGQLRSLYGALSDDIRATARANGPKAEGAWSRWNNYARARSNRIDNVVSLILGKNNERGAQSAFEAMQRLAADKGGDPIKLAQALRSMPEDEANTIRATMLDDLGHNPSGAQNGGTFSIAKYVTDWNKIGERAKNVLFTGEHRRALDDIANVFAGMKSSDKFANTSKTGIAIAAAHTGMVSLAHPVLGALDAALQFAGGKLLASPAFAKKLAATPMNAKGAQAFWSRQWVQAMAAKNPAIAGEIQAFQHAFLSHANDNSSIVTAASADPQQQNQ